MKHQIIILVQNWMIDPTNIKAYIQFLDIYIFFLSLYLKSLKEKHTAIHTEEK